MPAGIGFTQGCIDDIYYKIYKDDRYEHRLTIVCMQEFDEQHYVQANFYKDKDGNVPKFSDQQKAITYLNDNIKHEYIDPDYRKESWDMYRK